MRRNWIKLYVDQTLRGSCFDEMLPDERFVWFGFLLLAGDSAYEGKICFTENVGFTMNQLKELLRCDKELIERSIKKMVQYEKIKIYKDNVIEIINWPKYQSEYQRQKPHRESEFIKIREKIKKRDNYTCLSCNKSEKELDVPLCIHHIDNDPENNDPENLITLCMSCHSHLLKKSVHKTKKQDIKLQEERFKKIVQENSSTDKFNGEGEQKEKRKREDKDRKYVGDLFFDFSTGEFNSLCKTDIDNWKKVYSLLNVDNEFIKMRDWLIKNKGKKKAHKDDWRGFITGWLDRNQKEAEEKIENKERINKLVDGVIKDG